MKVRNLKANHSVAGEDGGEEQAVLANVKVRNLKANHSVRYTDIREDGAVLANVKVRNLKANHSGNNINQIAKELY